MVKKNTLNFKPGYYVINFPSYRSFKFCVYELTHTQRKWTDIREVIIIIQTISFFFSRKMIRIKKKSLACVFRVIVLFEFHFVCIKKQSAN